MTEAEQFAAIDAYKGNTMIVWPGWDVAARYARHRLKDRGITGLIAAAHDTRTGSRLVVTWRDCVAPELLEERIGNCLWLLEEGLAGRYPRPVAGELAELWTGGFPGSAKA